MGATDREAARGVAAMLAACVIWGLSGIYYRALAEVPPLELLAHRTLWSAAFLALLLGAQGRLRALGPALRGRGGRLLAFAAVMISVNWFVFIWSVQSGHALEASFGYYIFPLVSVLLGRVVLGERMDRADWRAAGLAAAGVLILGLGLGVAPWVSLILAGSFGLYGLAKKSLSVPPVVSVLAETLLLSPFALAVLLRLELQGGGHFGRDALHGAMLVFSGVLTAVPLLLFAHASQRVRMATVGLVQYLNPTIQFAVAALLFAEPVTLWHLLALPLIWAGLGLYTAARLRPRVTGD